MSVKMFSSRQSREHRIQEQLYQLKYLVKTLYKNANTYKKKQAEYAKKMKRAIKQGDERTAKVYAKQSVNYSDMALKSTQLACRVEVVESSARDAIQSGNVSSELVNVVQSISDHISPTSVLHDMGTFEKMFEDIMVSSNTMASVMGDSTVSDIADGGRENELMEWGRDTNALEQTQSGVSSIVSGLPDVDAVLNKRGDDSKVYF